MARTLRLGRRGRRFKSCLPESKIDLIVGKNEISIKVKSSHDESIQESFTVIKEIIAELRRLIEQKHG